MTNFTTHVEILTSFKRFFEKFVEMLQAEFRNLSLFHDKSPYSTLLRARKKRKNARTKFDVEFSYQYYRISIRYPNSLYGFCNISQVNTTSIYDRMSQYSTKGIGKLIGFPQALHFVASFCLCIDEMAATKKGVLFDKAYRYSNYFKWERIIGLYV